MMESRALLCWVLHKALVGDSCSPREVPVWSEKVDTREVFRSPLLQLEKSGTRRFSDWTESASHRYCVAELGMETYLPHPGLVPSFADSCM